MAANNNPIFSRVGDIQWSAVMTATNTTFDLTAGTIYTCFVADATNGGFVQKVRLHAAGGTTTVASAFRLWVNNGSATATASNNALFDEITLSATATTSASATPNFEIPVNVGLPPGYRLYGTLGTNTTGGWYAVTFGGKY